MEGTIEGMLINTISTVGIPGAVAFYVLARVNSSLDALTKAVIKLTAKIDAHLGK